MELTAEAAEVAEAVTAAVALIIYTAVTEALA
jgi:hypothetical protein